MDYWHPEKQNLKLALAIVTALAVTGCNSSGSSSGSDDDGNVGDDSGGESAQASHYHFVQGSLKAVHPDAPGNLVTVDPDARMGSAIPILSGNWEDNGVSGLAIARVFYARNDGTLWQVETEPDANGNVRTPTQVSNESAATEFCEFHSPYDFADIDRTPVIYQLPGADSDCSTPGDNAWHLISLNDNSTASPRNFSGEPVAWLHDTSDGSHDGWLALHNGALERVRVDSTTTTIATGVGYALLLGGLNDGSQLLSVDGALMRYVPGSSNLETLNHRFNDQNLSGQKTTLASVVGTTELYFVDGGALHRTDVESSAVVPLDDPGDAAETSNRTAGIYKGPMTLTDNYVVWTYQQTDGDHAIRRAGRSSGNNAQALFSEGSGEGNVDGTLVQSLAYTAMKHTDKWVFYNKLDADTNRSVAVAQNVDQPMNRSLENDAQWVGASVARSAGTNLDTAAVSHVFAYQDAFGPSLRALNHEDGFDSPSNQVGDLPDDVKSVMVVPGFGAQRLGTIVANDGQGSTQSDVFWMDGEGFNSFERITDTPNTNETPVMFF